MIVQKNARMLSNEEALELVRKIPRTTSTPVETMRYMVQTYIGTPPSCRPKEDLRGMGLTEFEAVQLVNICPRTVLDVHVVVEEMEERLDESQVCKILSLF